MINIGAQHWPQLEPLLGAAASRVFTFYKLSVEPQEGGFGDEQLLAGVVLGFTGERLRGGLVLTTTLELLTASHPMTGHGQSQSEDELTDWLGELANQIVGRFKSDLCEQGVVISLSTPTCLTGRGLRRHGQQSPGALALRVGGQPLRVELTGEIEDALILCAPAAPAAAPPRRRMALL